jgi:murein DD-endopeptidase MepM/ murein hydrolase activator NlpD
LAALLVLGLATPAHASLAPTRRQSQINQQIEALRNDFQEASEEEDQLVGRVTQARQRQAEIDARIRTLDVQLAGVQKEVDAAQARLDEMSAQTLAAEQRLEEARNQLARAKRDLERRAIAAYVGQTDLQVANASMAATDNRRYAASEGYLQTIVSKQRDAVDRFHKLKLEAVELQVSLEQQRDQARMQRDVVAQQASHLEAVRAQNEGARREAAAQQAQQNALLAEVRANKEAAAAKIAQLRAESDSISAFLRRSQGGGTVVVGRGILAYPIPGARITSTFGPRVHPIFGDVRMHTGIDFAAGMGTPIRAAGDGVVLSAGVRGGYGNTTLIDHGGSLATMYCHQSSFAVVPGQRVAKGQVIGYVGSTGFSTGPHLHFETRVNGTPVDPMQFL